MKGKINKSGEVYIIRVILFWLFIVLYIFGGRLIMIPTFTVFKHLFFKGTLIELISDITYLIHFVVWSRWNVCVSYVPHSVIRSSFREILIRYIYVKLVCGHQYMCNLCLSLKLDSDKVCQWLGTGRWFSSTTPVSSINKTDRHDLTEILFKVALNTIAIKLKVVLSVVFIYILIINY